MTDLLTTDHADSGEVVRLHPSIVDTFVLDVRDLGKPTSNLSAYAPVPPMWALRDGPSTGEYQTYRRLADVETLQQPGQPAPPRPMPAPGPPPRPATVTGYQPAIADVRKPLLGRGNRRAPAPAWARRALLLGLGSVGTVALELAGIAALAVLR